MIKATCGATPIPPATTGSSPWATFALAAVATFIVALDTTIVVAAFPALRDAFSTATPATLSWVLNSYTIIYAALLVPAGRVADIYGPRRIFFLGVALFTVGSALCGLAPTLPILIGARVLQAVGGAVLTPASLTLVLSLFPSERRSMVVGLWSAAGALGAALGPGLGGSLIDAAGWRSAFLINLPVGAALLVLARTRLPAPRPGAEGERLDIPGVLLLIAAMGALTWGVVSAEAGVERLVLGLVVGVSLLAGFALWARGRPNAAVNLSLFTDRTFATVTLATLTFGIAFAMMFLSGFLFLTGPWGFSESLAGAASMPGPLTVIAVAIASGRLVRRVGHRAILVIGGLLYAAAQGTMALLVTSEPSYWSLWLPSQMIGGTGVGLLLTGLAGAAVRDLPMARLGVGGAVNNAVRQFGSVVGTAFAVLLVGEAGAGLPDFRHALLAISLLALVTAALSLPVKSAAKRVAGA